MEDNQYNNNNNINIPYSQNNQNIQMIIQNMQKKDMILSQENMKLKEILQRNKQIYNQTISKLNLMENSVKQGKILLNNTKKDNDNLKKRIIELEKKEKELNYKLIESNQKIKSLSENINELNAKKNTNINPNEQIFQLKEIINQKEILIAKLNLDNNNFKKKFSEIKQ